MTKQGVILGKEDGSFGANEQVSRADFLVMVMRAYPSLAPATEQDNFNDAGDTYYTPYLARAKAAGVVNAIGDNQFYPEEPITRQDMMVMLHRLLTSVGNLPPTGQSPVFQDQQDIADYAKTAVYVMTAAGIVTGYDGKINPTAFTLRCEAAQI